MSRSIRILCIATAVAACINPVLFARETRVKRSDLPPAVEKTVVEQSRGATILGFTKEAVGGKTMYEAEMKVNGHSKDVLMNADGSVAEVEEQVQMSALSAEVQSGLKGKAGGGKILKVESLSKHGQLVAYEAVVAHGAKKSEIQVGPDGRSLDHEE